MARRQDFNANDPIIVVGSGIAGLLLSIELASAGRQVHLVTKGSLCESNTNCAQGGIAAVTELNPADSIDQHLMDTFNSGDGLTDIEAAARIVGGGGRLVQRLAELGVNFDAKSLALEGGHVLARVLHCADATGRAIIEALTAKALSLSNIRIYENSFLSEVITDERGALGIEYIEEGGDSSPDSHRSMQLFGKVVLCTGGLGRIYARTTNPLTATGDGIAAAFRAGAALVDMEFVQFHPTALALPGAPAFLISEAVRGAGAMLLNTHGQRFVHRYFPEGELATRDKVSQAIHREMKEEGSTNAWLDLSAIGKSQIQKQFPNIVAKCREFGIDPVTTAIPVAPAAHYFMGGILTDADGRTTVPGLYAIGECACTGLHGANRLASNSLLEGGVMAMNLAKRFLSDETDEAFPIFRPEAQPVTFRRDRHIDPAFIAKGRIDPLSRLDLEKLRNRLLHDVGIARSEESLLDFINFGLSASDTILDTVPTYCTSDAPNFILSTVPFLDSPNKDPLFMTDYMRASDSHSTHLNDWTATAKLPLNGMPSDATLLSCQSALDGTTINCQSRRYSTEKNAAYTLGLLIAQSALFRAESRGAQWREDYPSRDDLRFKGHIAYNGNGITWLPARSPTIVASARAQVIAN